MRTRYGEWGRTAVRFAASVAPAGRLAGRGCDRDAGHAPGWRNHPAVTFLLVMAGNAIFITVVRRRVKHVLEERSRRLPPTLSPEPDA